MNNKNDIIYKPVWVSDYQQPHLKIRYALPVKPNIKTQKRYKQFDTLYIIWRKNNVRDY